LGDYFTDWYKYNSKIFDFEKRIPDEITLKKYLGQRSLGVAYYLTGIERPIIATYVGSTSQSSHFKTYLHLPLLSIILFT
jgi:hypothetical protein